jgi:hypothetical protein
MLEMIALFMCFFLKVGNICMGVHLLFKLCKSSRLKHKSITTYV